MSFGDAVKLCLTRYVTFSGRSPRSEFWWWMFFLIFVDIAVGGLLRMAGADALDSIISIALALPTFAVTSRRLHDVGRSGWWQAGLYPLGVAFALPAGVLPDAIGGVFFMASFLVFLVTLVLMLIRWTRPGTPGPNAYGPPPGPLPSA